MRLTTCLFIILLCFFFGFCLPAGFPASGLVLSFTVSCLVLRLSKLFFSLRNIEGRCDSCLLLHARQARGTSSIVWFSQLFVQSTSSSSLRIVPLDSSICTSSHFLSGRPSRSPGVRVNQSIPTYQQPRILVLSPQAESRRAIQLSRLLPAHSKRPSPPDGVSLGRQAPAGALCRAVLPPPRQPRSARRPLATTATPLGEKRCECGPWRGVHCTLSYSHSVTPLDQPASCNFLFLPVCYVESFCRCLSSSLFKERYIVLLLLYHYSPSLRLLQAFQSIVPCSYFRPGLFVSALRCSSFPLPPLFLITRSYFPLPSHGCRGEREVGVLEEPLQKEASLLRPAAERQAGKFDPVLLLPPSTSNPPFNFVPSSFVFHMVLSLA